MLITISELRDRRKVLRPELRFESSTWFASLTTPIAILILPDHGLSAIMAIVSAFTMIRSLSLFHITLAFFFLTAPRMIADQNLVYILGESMKVVCLCSPYSLTRGTLLIISNSLTAQLSTNRPLSQLFSL